MGAAVNWQQGVERALVDLDVWIANPRRPVWDSASAPRMSNPQFAEQVDWEHRALLRASLVFFYFAPGSKAPVSLLELGYVLGLGKDVVVCCSPEFWRSGNVEFMTQSCRTMQTGRARYTTNMSKALREVRQWDALYRAKLLEITRQSPGAYIAGGWLQFTAGTTDPGLEQDPAPDQEPAPEEDDGTEIFHDRIHTDPPGPGRAARTLRGREANKRRTSRSEEAASTHTNDEDHDGR
jgi:hypothetical protein